MSSPKSELGHAFRESLKKLREIRNLTQSELGERAGIAAAAVSHFETGQRVPSLDSLVRLADALGVSVDELLGRDVARSPAGVDPIFLRASRASMDVLDTVKRVTAALLDAKPSR
ncbi:MAG: helix-turn-helix transcriptional regulator [Planctomycetia bacterium]|nr:helix-turn-helix transcriptional regulator [Planctomycetia bacterium]